jgi:hypothetical protein
LLRIGGEEGWGRKGAGKVGNRKYNNDLKRPISPFWGARAVDCAGTTALLNWETCLPVQRKLPMRPGNLEIIHDLQIFHPFSVLKIRRNMEFVQYA